MAKTTATTTTADIKKILTPVDKSTRALQTAADTLTKTVTELTASVAALTTQQVDLANDIEFKQSELETIANETAVKQREQAAELRLRVREDEDTVFAELLKERGLVTQTPEEVQSIKSQLAEALEDNQDAIDDAVAKAVAEVTATYKTQLAQKDSDHKVQIATLQANEKATQERLNFLTTQNAKLETQIEEDRKARVEIAKAEASRQAVTVNTNGK